MLQATLKDRLRINRYDDGSVSSSSVDQPSSSKYANQYEGTKATSRLTADDAFAAGIASLTQSSKISDTEEVVDKRHRMVIVLVVRIMQDLFMKRGSLHAETDHVTSVIYLLTSFATRIGDDGWLLAMTFVDHYKWIIAKRIVESVKLREEIDPLDLSETDTTGPSSDLSTNLYVFHTRLSGRSEFSALDDLESERKSDVDSPSLDYKDLKLVFSSTAYQWLVGQLHREFTTYIPDQHEATTIKTSVLRDLEEAVNIKPKTEPEIHTVILSLDWHLDAYIIDQSYRLKEQGWPESSVLSLDSIENAISITGSSVSAQALTCGAYLDQTWPKVGRELLNLVIAVNEADTEESQGYLAGGTKIRLFRNSDGLQVTIQGTVFAIAEVVEIFGWLSSTFRSQPHTKGPYCCMASIKKAQEKLMPEARSIVSAYKMYWEMQPANKNDRNTCWYNMFANPTIVLGYPIARKAEQEAGLEIPIAMIEVLLQDAQICVLDGQLYIKSFAAMLVLTKRDGDFLMWHYYYKEDGSYIDFLEAEIVEKTEPVDYCELGSYRHVVGWSPNVTFRIGSPWQEGQTIGPSGLDSPTPTYSFKNFSFSASYMGVGFALPIALGVKDPPKWIKPKFKAIEHKLDHLSRIFVVLWDTADNRGWLIDGVSTLLHLLRGSLEASRRRFQSTFRLDLKDFVEPHLQTNDMQYPEAAEEFFLCNDHYNLGLTVFQGVRTGIVSEQQAQGLDLETPISRQSGKQKQEGTMVEDEFSCLWSKLAHIAFLSKQASKKYQDGKEARLQDVTGTPYLLGCDFSEIMRSTTDIQPRMAKLSPTAAGWIDLPRSIATVNLFGTGFGELIVPSHDACQSWRTVPREMCYLAAGEKTLDKIVEEGQYPKLKEKIHPVSPERGHSCCTMTHLHTLESRNVLRRSIMDLNVTTDCPAALIFGAKWPKKVPASSVSSASWYHRVLIPSRSERRYMPSSSLQSKQGRY